MTISAAGWPFTAYALLTGRPPFEHSSLPERVRRIREETPERPKKRQLAVADLFEGAVLRLLAKHPDERHSQRRSYELICGELESIKASRCEPIRSTRSISGNAASFVQRRVVVGC
jgi:hypothetical protein